MSGHRRNSRSLSESGRISIREGRRTPDGGVSTAPVSAQSSDRRFTYAVEFQDGKAYIVVEE